MPRHQANLSEKHAQTGINVCTPERLPLVEVGGGGRVVRVYTNRQPTAVL